MNANIKDGVLTCTSIKLNCKQVKNLITDGAPSLENGTAGNYYGWWDIKPTTYRSAHSAGYNNAQRIPTLTTNHKYYFSFYGEVNAITNADTIGIYNNEKGTGNYLCIFDMTTKFSALCSCIFTAISDFTTPFLVLKHGHINNVNSNYYSRFILIDLTNAFGAGQEPTQAWCNLHIREHNTFMLTDVLDERSPSWGAILRSTSSGGMYPYWCGESNATWRDSYVPMDYMVYYSPDAEEIQVRIDNNTAALEVGHKYYSSCYCYFSDDTLYRQFLNSNASYDSNNFLGSDWVLPATTSNSGGNMAKWRKYSFLGKASYTSYPSAYFTIYYNAKQIGSNQTYIAALNLCDVESYKTAYEQTYGCTLEDGDITKEWCDCWIDGRNLTFIHIDTPYDRTIKFDLPLPVITANKSYDVSDLDGFIGKQSDPWNDIIDTSKLTIGKDAIIKCTEKTTNKIVYFRVKILAIDGSTITANNYGWEYEDEPRSLVAQGCSIQCNRIEVHPEIKYVRFDKNGVVWCRKLDLKF